MPNDHQLLTLLLGEVSTAASARARAAVAGHALEDRAIALLLALAALERPSQHEIAEHTQMDRTTVSKTIDRLESVGLVRRHVDPRQRRRNSISLTPRGRRTVSELSAAFVRCDAEFLAPLGAADRRELERILRALLDAQRPAGEA
jgi:DNA-binding MarR family transcriptional regulator